MLCPHAGADGVGRARCCTAVCETLHRKGHDLLGSGLVSGIIGAIGHLLSALQVCRLGCPRAIARLQSRNHSQESVFYFDGVESAG